MICRSCTPSGVMSCNDPEFRGEMRIGVPVPVQGPCTHTHTHPIDPAAEEEEASSPGSRDGWRSLAFSEDGITRSDAAG